MIHLHAYLVWYDLNGEKMKDLRTGDKNEKKSLRI